MLRSAESASAATRPPAAFDSNALDRGKHLAIILALAALALVTFAESSASRMHTWPWAAVVTTLWLVPIGMVFVGVARQASWRLPPPALSAGLALLAIGALVSAILSPFSGASLPRIWPTLGGVALYLTLHDAWSSPDADAERRFQRIARVLAGAGVAFIAVTLAYWSRGSWPLPWGTRNTSPFGHSTYTSGAIILLLPWIVLQAAFTRRAVRFAWYLAAAGALLVLLSTSSRGGVLALAVMIAAAASVALFGSRWSRRRKLTLIVVLSAIGALAVLANPRLRDLVLHRGWSEGARESNVQRQAMLSAGFKLGRERPLIGWGPGTIPLAYPRVRAELDGGTENILQLHNTPIQIWATTGATGTLAIFLLGGGMLVSILRAPRTPVTGAASASLLGYAVVSLTDHQLDLPMMTAWIATNLALLTAGSSLRHGATTARWGALSPTGLRGMDATPAAWGQAAPPSVRTRTRVLILVPFAVAAFVALPATVRDLRARQIYERALVALSQNESGEFIKRLDHATVVAPHDPFFEHQAAGALLEQRAALRDPVRQHALAREAASRLERSLITGAHEEFAHFNLGWLHLDLGRPADAARHFAAAARLVPDKGGVYFGLGLAHEAAGRRDAAVRCFALEWINDPRSLTSPAWEIPTLAALRPAVREEVIRLCSGLPPEFPGARTMAAWLPWWGGESLPPDAVLPGFNTASARLVSVLPAIQRGEPLPADNAPWAIAYSAWRSARGGGAAAQPDAFLPAAAGDRAFAGALARRARQYRDDFRPFLVAPAGDEPACVTTLRRQRTGYGILALHPEGPPLHDLYIVQENRVAADLAAGLFPSKGWLPGRFLLARLPEESR